MKYLSESASAALISCELAYSAVEKAFIAAVQDATAFPVVIAHGPVKDHVFSLKSATTPQLCGWKTGSYWASNIDKGMPCHASTIFLLDPNTGRLDAVIEASKVNAFRTAAADAVAVNNLARKEATCLTVFGTGHQAAYECRAIAQVRSLKVIQVVGRSVEKTNLFVQDLQQQGYNAVACEAQQACENADIIVTATKANKPLFQAEWVREGTHVSAMGVDGVGKQELPLGLFNKASLFCDLMPQSTTIGEFQHCLKGAEAPVVTMMGNVLLGNQPGRKTPQEITVFDSSGISLQDLFMGQSLLHLAQEQGQVLELGC